MGHCFDCQVKIQNKLRVEGKWEEYEKKKILENKNIITEIEIFAPLRKSDENVFFIISFIHQYPE